jgi:hypothetical protein
LATQGAGKGAIRKIVVRIQVGTKLMAGTDDPVYLRLTGPSGREFRLKHAHGRTLRRGKEDVFVFGGPGEAETNVAHPELNDPSHPALDLAAIDGVQLTKGFEPLPNVRGVGEMDDRLLIDRIEVDLHTDARPEPWRFERSGPLWLGLICGLGFELAPAGDPG